MYSVKDKDLIYKIGLCHMGVELCRSTCPLLGVLTLSRSLFIFSLFLLFTICMTEGKKDDCSARYANLKLKQFTVEISKLQ